MNVTYVVHVLHCRACGTSYARLAREDAREPYSDLLTYAAYVNGYDPNAFVAPTRIVCQICNESAAEYTQPDDPHASFGPN